MAPCEEFTRRSDGAASLWVADKLLQENLSDVGILQLASVLTPVVLSAEGSTLIRQDVASTASTRSTGIWARTRADNLRDIDAGAWMWLSRTAALIRPLQPA
ncbi:hypothetical protein ACFV2H_47710 [Streptomyces sp. NPDC059629]|uniref:hypothetical protein n=1 Tax=Streptomyces sp. NPDC059629 TaxID=3346889 RepID=UPI0036907B92